MQSIDAIPPQLSGIYIAVMSPEELPGLYRERSNNTFLATKIAQMEPIGIFFKHAHNRELVFNKERCLKDVSAGRRWVFICAKGNSVVHGRRS